MGRGAVGDEDWRRSMSNYYSPLREFSREQLISTFKIMISKNLHYTTIYNLLLLYSPLPSNYIYVHDFTCKSNNFLKQFH